MAFLPMFTERTTMKRVVPALLVLAALAGGCNSKPGPLPPIDVYFSPQGGAAGAVVQALDTAKQAAFVQAYSFTNREIAEALVRAHQRGIVVHVILDKSELKDRNSMADYVANAGIPVLIDAKHPIAHNKVMIIDGETLITGSFNFTQQAEQHNAENLLVIHDHGLAERYLANWHEHEAHSGPYAGQGEMAQRPTSDRNKGPKQKSGFWDE
jgi:phosphatidylserine/phosphatidylglycerophosphate/cardiolipin synthase-like enzyme